MRLPCLPSVSWLPLIAGCIQVMFFHPGLTSRKLCGRCKVIGVPNETRYALLWLPIFPLVQIEKKGTIDVLMYWIVDRCLSSYLLSRGGKKKERIIINRLSRVFKDHIYNMAGSNQTSRKFLLFVGSWFTPNGEIDYHCRLGSLYGFVVLDVGPLLELGRLGGSNVEMVNDEYRWPCFPG